MSRFATAITGAMVVALGCGLVNTAPSPKPQTKTFRSVSVDGRGRIVGQYPVAEASCELTSCYHLEYDAAKRLIRVEYRDLGYLRPSPDIGAARIIIEHSDGWERRLYQDVDGGPTAVKGGVYSERYRLDDNGHYSAVFKYDEAGELTEDVRGVTQYSYEVDERGCIIVSVSRDASGEKIARNNGVPVIRTQCD